MPMTLKEPLKELPPIDAQAHFNPSPEYANEVLDKLLRFYTLSQISAHTDISRRNLSYFRHRGISTYPMQIALELLIPQPETES